jgi:hypothetical protein
MKDGKYRNPMWRARAAGHRDSVIPHSEFHLPH